MIITGNSLRGDILNTSGVIIVAAQDSTHIKNKASISFNAVFALVTNLINKVIKTIKNTNKNLINNNDIFVTSTNQLFFRYPYAG